MRKPFEAPKLVTQATLTELTLQDAAVISCGGQCL
jgi:hypothetical protein